MNRTVEELFSFLPSSPDHPPRPSMTKAANKQVAVTSLDAATGPPTTAPQYASRQWWRKVPFVSTRPINEPLTRSSDEVTPEDSAHWWSKLFFLWCQPLLRIGYTRPLTGEELYTMPDSRKAALYAAKLEEAWRKQCEKADKKRERQSTERKSLFAKLSKPTEAKPSLTLALNEVTFQWFWMGGLFKLIGDLATITSPLLVRFIINSINVTEGDRAAYEQKKGYGLTVGLFVLLCISVIGQVHGFYRGYTTGILLRTALLHTIYRRATKLSEKSRTQKGFGTAKLTSLMSADVSRIDTCCGQFHMAWTSIVQIIVCFILLCVTLGYSAIPGFGLVLVMYPVQKYMVKQLFSLRRKSMPSTDARVKAMVEAVSGIRLIKSSAWEPAFLRRIAQFRGREMMFLRKRFLLRSLNLAISFTVPTIGAVISIICYIGTGHAFRAGEIFSSLAFFLLIRIPLQLLPIALSSIADARAAIERLEQFMLQPMREPDPPIAEEMQEMIDVRNASFVHHDDLDYDNDGEKDGATHPTSTSLFIDKLTVQRGSLCVIVGPVGSGKSSLLRALLGDMQCLRADKIALGAPSSYCPQTAWLRSTTIRENIVFGVPFEQSRYDDCIHRCCLTADLTMLPDGDMTVVGEKGISLSGGQKQRVSLARALYATMHGRPLCILDDCFSALDAYVGATVMQRVVLEGRRSRSIEQRPTFVIVTHSLSLAKHADQIIYMDKGEIVEQASSYEEAMQKQGAFAELVQKTMSKSGESSGDEQLDLGKEEVVTLTKDDEGRHTDAKTSVGDAAPAAEPKKKKEIMQKEERLVGSVSKRTYLHYLLLGRAGLTMPLFLASILFYQGATILSPLWLKYWQEMHFTSLDQSAYMGIFAALGVGQSFGLFSMSAAFALFTYFASVNIHARSAKRVLYAPMSFFDTTPQGRITHRFSRDIDAIDNLVGETLRLFISTTVQALGTVILIAIILPYFLCIAAVVVIVYIWTGMFYRPSSRELRRLNNLLRSRIYEHFSESLSGLTTLRAYGALVQAKEDNAVFINSENRAYWLSIAAQRWLNIRLDMFGAVLVLGVGLLVIGLREQISPASAGVVLSSMVSMQSIFGQMIRQSAEIENNMNSIERVLHYVNNIEQEEPHEQPDVDQALRKDSWPSKGAIAFQDVAASYRPGLPLALRGITFSIEPKEKIGIVGRTGAGKTTVLSILLRMIEASSGSITIDGVDTRSIGLDLLRRQISCISQDAVLFAGTLRYNLDPFEQFDDARLWWALKQAKLCGAGETSEASSANSETDVETDESTEKNVQKSGSGGDGGGARRELSLDMEITLDGANLSQGQRALVSIARALVKEAKVVLLDEATASIDAVLDGEVQIALRQALKEATVLTVAHRLDTVISSSDKICVVDKGQVAQFGPPETLYADEQGIFRQLCTSAGINEEDIVTVRQNANL